MYFKKMEIQGFKSFAEHVNIEFHDGITCIVGPNGSGKSNISDALKWVLGEQSPKSLRGSKMEDVIFSGTSTRKSRGMAEVSLLLDNTSKILPIDFSEVSITRRMYRSGESEYLINNNQCRLKDIKGLIMDTGIGVDGYSMIGQGKIIEIINGKPEERRKIFEEVAGIVKYRTKKSEAERKLDSTNQNLLRVNDIITELETRIDPLKLESDKAKEYLLLKERIKTIDINLTLKNIDTIENRLQNYKNEIENLNQEITNISEEKSNLEKDTNDKKAQNEALEAESQEIQEKLMVLVQEMNHYENTKKVNEEKISSYDKETTRINDELNRLDTKIEIEKETIQEWLQKKEEVEANYLSINKEHDEKLNTYNERDGLLKANIEKMESEKSKIIDLYNMVTTKKAEINSIQSLKGTLLKRKNQINEDFEAVKNVNHEITEKYNHLMEDKKIKNVNLSQITERQDEKQSQYQDDLKQEKQINFKLQSLKNKLNEVKTRQRVLTDMDNAYEGYNHAVKVLMKDASRQQGIHGVVANLIEVPQGFEIAIETALGQALQNIICQNNDSAKKSIEYLKKNNAGRLTFLPIESIKPYKKKFDSRIKASKGFKGYAVECIKYKPDYCDIMEYLLGKVVIVDKLDHAIEMSKKFNQGMRIVTLEGDVINSSGAITGGSFKNNRGNILGRKAEAKKMNELALELEKEYTEKNNFLQQKQKEIEAVSHELYDLEKAYKALESDIQSIDNNIHKLENEMVIYNDSEKKWQREIDDIEKEEARVKTMTQNLTSEVEGYEAQARQIEASTQQGMDQYDEEKKRLGNMYEAITELKLKIATSENEKSNIKENINRSQNYMNELKNDKEHNTNTLTELKETKSMVETNNIQLSETIREKNVEKVQLENNKKENTLLRENLTKLISESMTRKEEIDQRIYQVQQTKHEMDIKVTKSETQIEGLKDKLWDDFEVSYIQAIELRSNDFKFTEASKEAKEIRQRLKELGDVNVGSIQEYDMVKERFEFLNEQRTDLLEAIGSLDQVIEDMDKAIKINFRTTFKKVAEHFECIFKELFSGGTAMVKMENEDNLLETGIEIIAQPPGKKLQNITLLSGGEKTLTAIALMFAILKVKPTPFCILDEVEAALDDTNINRFASYLRNFDDIQFVLVTHQKATMEFADVLYGVTMPEQGISKVLSLKLEEKAG
ncbi:MAG: chromosome segregation protein SMC [Clostridia bacterium]|nr:chromosome segregation protein SMC [Clostridia bacterium]